MLRLAQFVLRGPMYAIGTSVVTMALPFLFWLAAAVVALVFLRLGPRQGLNIGLWTALPAAAWLFLGQDPAPLTVLLISMVLAGVLHATISWQNALLAGAVAAAVLGQLSPLLAPAFLEQVVEMGTQVYQEMDPEMAQELGEDAETAVRTMMIGSLAAINFVIAMLACLLARGWQARLFNPGGLQREFHDFRLTGPVSLVMVLVMAFGPYIGLNPGVALLVFGIPLLLGGIALVHGVVARRAMSKGWLVALYVALILLGPTLLFVLVFVAILDSWLNIRQRIAPV